MASKQQREELMKAFLETPEAKIWHEATKALKLQATVQPNKKGPVPEFIRLVIDEMVENPTMFSVLRDIWNQLCVKMNLPDEIRG